MLVIFCCESTTGCLLLTVTELSVGVQEWWKLLDGWSICSVKAWKPDAESQSTDLTWIDYKRDMQLPFGSSAGAWFLRVVALLGMYCSNHAERRQVAEEGAKLLKPTSYYRCTEGLICMAEWQRCFSEEWMWRSLAVWRRRQKGPGLLFWR